SQLSRRPERSRRETSRYRDEHAFPAFHEPSSLPRAARVIQTKRLIVLRRRWRREHLARAVRLERPDETRGLHRLDHARSAVVANLQATLDARDRCLAA